MVELKTGITLKFPSNNLSNFTVMRNASGVNQFKAVDQNGNNGMLFKVKDNSEFSVNVWKDNAFGNEKILATKDDLGVFLTTYGTKAAVYRSNINITSLNLPAGHTYLILGSTQVDTSVSLISASLSAPSNEYGTTFGLSQMRTTGSNGGGCMTAAIMSLKKDFTVSINGYGYDNATYNYIGYLIAIRLK